MKKIILTIIVGISLLSCSNKQKSVTVNSTFKNTSDSLNIRGIYEGIEPSADSEGMKVVVLLDDSTYSRQIQYLGQKPNTPFIDKGKYQWDAKQNIIRLLGSDKNSPNLYEVGDKCLIQLDMSGNRITGQFANMYILKKK